jgi:hypothetical protein
LSISNEATKAVNELGFPPFQEVSGRSAVFDLVPPSKRCGIYVLAFKTGELYAGKAVDVARRFGQHTLRHLDITHFTYRCVSEPRLSTVERDVVWHLERVGLPLRNILLTSLPKGESDLDTVVSLTDQARWTGNTAWNVLTGTRPNDEAIRRRGRGSFERLQKRPFASATIGFLRLYARTFLLAPMRTELSFWSVTSVPSSSVHARVNINWMEVLTLFTYERELNASFHVARSPLTTEYGSRLAGLFRRYPGLVRGERLYDPGGEDQVHLVAISVEMAHRLLQDCAFRQAGRLINWRLMKKGPCAYSRYHSFSLADHMLESA